MTGLPEDIALSVLALDELAWSGSATTGAPGLPAPLWRHAVVALDPSRTALTDDDLLSFADGCPLVQSGPTGYRLADPSTVDTLRPADRAAAERRITTAWLVSGWDESVLRALPVHAAAAGMVDALLAEDEVLVRDDRDVLLALASSARSRAGRLRACLLALAPEPAAFSVTSTVEGLGVDVRTNAPYRAVWARTGARVENSVLTGHTDDVNAVCQLLVDGHPVLATASSDQTIRLWDLGTARLDLVLTGHAGTVDALCPAWWDGREVLASGGEDRTVRLWNPATGEALLSLVDSTWVRALCAGPELLAAAGDDGVIRLWDPVANRVVRTLTGHTGPVTGLFWSHVDGRHVLVSVGTGDTVRVWDPATGEPVRVLRRGEPGETAAAALGSPARLALAEIGGAIQLWDLASGAVARTLPAGDGPAFVEALCELRSGGRSRRVPPRRPALGPGHRGAAARLR